MNKPKSGIQSKLQAAYQEIRKDEEKIEMRMTSNISKVKTWVSQSLATRRPVKLLAVVALGTLMITVTGLQFVPSQSDESERSVHDVVLISGAPAGLAGFTPNQQVEILGEMDDFPVDGSSSYQPVLIPGAPAGLAGFTPNQQVEILGEMDDFPVVRVVNPAWISGDDRTPQYFDEGTTEDQAPVVKTELDPEAMDDLIRYAYPSDLERSESGTSALEAQGTPLDAWMYDSPFYQDFSKVGGIDFGASLGAQDPPLDAWMHDSPFYQDFSKAGRIEVGTPALGAQDPPLDAWMHDSPFYGIS